MRILAIKKGVLVLIVLLGMLFVRCGFLWPPDIADDRNIAMYDEARSYYPDSYLSHLPDISETGMSALVIKIPNNCINGIWVIVGYDKKEMVNNMRDSIVKKTIAHYKWYDPCLRIVDYAPEIYNGSHFPLRTCNDIPECILPVPNFRIAYETFLPDKFYKKAEIYILDAKYGANFDKEYLSSKDVGLPGLWAHGYSRGVVLGDKYAIWKIHRALTPCANSKLTPENILFLTPKVS